MASLHDGYLDPGDWNATEQFAGGPEGVARVVNYAARQKSLQLASAGYYSEGGELHYAGKIGRKAMRETHQADLSHLKTAAVRNNAVLKDGKEQHYEPGEVMVEEAHQDSNGKWSTRLVKSTKRLVKQVNDHVDQHTGKLSRVNMTDQYVEAVKPEFLKADGVENITEVRRNTIEGVLNGASSTWSTDPEQRGFYESALKRILGKPKEDGSGYYSEETGDVSTEEQAMLLRGLESIKTGRFSDLSTAQKTEQGGPPEGPPEGGLGS